MDVIKTITVVNEILKLGTNLSNKKKQTKKTRVQEEDISNYSESLYTCLKWLLQQSINELFIHTTTTM